MTIRNPSYRYHKARDCAVVTINGKNHYLGAYDSEERGEQYHRLIAEFLEDKRRPANQSLSSPSPLTVNELVLVYWRHVESYYVKDGRPTSEQATIRHALRFVRRLYGSTAVNDFSPKSLKAVRQSMIEHPITRKIKVLDKETGEVKETVKHLHQGLTRKFINKQIGRINRMFAWAVEEELVPVTVHQALLRVTSLKKGKTLAREKPRIRSVSEDAVEAVIPFVRPVIQSMIRIQRLCGCRPQDVEQLDQMRQPYSDFNVLLIEDPIGSKHQFPPVGAARYIKRVVQFSLPHFERVTNFDHHRHLAELDDFDLFNFGPIRFLADRHLAFNPTRFAKTILVASEYQFLFKPNRDVGVNELIVIVEIIDDHLVHTHHRTTILALAFERQIVGRFSDLCRQNVLKLVRSELLQ